MGRASPDEGSEGSDCLSYNPGSLPFMIYIGIVLGWQQSGGRSSRGHLQRVPYPEETGDCLFLRSLLRRKETFPKSLPNRLPLMSHQQELGHLPMLRPNTAEGKNSHD